MLDYIVRTADDQQLDELCLDQQVVDFALGDTQWVVNLTQGQYDALRDFNNALLTALTSRFRHRTPNWRRDDPVATTLLDYELNPATLPAPRTPYCVRATGGLPDDPCWCGACDYDSDEDQCDHPDPCTDLPTHHANVYDDIPF